MSREAVLASVGSALILAGLYEGASPRLGKPSITELGQRWPELPAALTGALLAHFFVQKRPPLRGK